VTAIATLFIRQDNGKVTCDQFEYEDGDEIDPYHRAWGLWESCKDDFPEAAYAIHVNDEAREMMRDARMRAMGLE
jgi:hypothetical protein